MLEPGVTYGFVKLSAGQWAAGDGAWNAIYIAEALVGLTGAAALWWLRQHRDLHA